jgi:hypothetical protein
MLEPVGCQLGMTHRVLNVAPEVRLQRGRVMSRIREGEPAGMSEHVGVDL